MNELPMSVFGTAEEAAQRAADAILLELRVHADERTTLFLSGGSSVRVAQIVFANITPAELPNLRVAQVDERFGEVDHPDSNWLRLRTAIPELEAWPAIPVLNRSADRRETAESYAFDVAESLSGYTIALLGMGADGHIAGILPMGSEEDFIRRYASSGLVSDYEGPDYDRITLSPAALAQIEDLVLFTTGPQKFELLSRISPETPVNEQPVMMLQIHDAVQVYVSEEET